MKKARLILLIGLCAVWPATASAQSDILDWLQAGSGPGPYKSIATGYEIRVWCPPVAGITISTKRKIWNCFLDDPDQTRAVLSFSQDWASSEGRQLFLDDPNDVREVKERRLTGAFTYRANKFLSVGGTIDAIQFKSDQGNAFSIWRLGLGPRVVFTPCAKCASTAAATVASSATRFIHLQVDTTWIPQGLSAAAFNNTVSRYDPPGATFQVRTTLAIDFAFVLRAIHQ